MIDIYDFDKRYSLWTDDNDELQYVIRNELKGLDYEDFEELRVFDSKFKPIVMFGKIWFTFVLSARLANKKELKLEIVLDKLKDDIYVIYIAHYNNILHMKFFDTITSLTKDAIDEVEKISTILLNLRANRT